MEHIIRSIPICNEIELHPSNSCEYMDGKDI